MFISAGCTLFLIPGSALAVNLMELTPAKRKMEASPEQPELKLTAEEEALFDVLTKVVAHFQLNAVLRVAGGWVRDKLMVRKIKLLTTNLLVSQFKGKSSLLL